ncbi:MAG: glycosyltransferase [Candidatus Zixiibacteriota bacterium]
MDVKNDAPSVMHVSSDDAEPRELAGRINGHLEANQLESALELLGRLAELLPDDLQTLLTAGLVAACLNRNHEADRFFTLAVEAAPTDYDANYNLALARIDRTRYDDAEKILKRLHESDPENAGLLNDLGVVASLQVADGRAIKHFSQALELDPNNADALENVLALMSKKGRFDEGRQLLRMVRNGRGLKQETLTALDRWGKILDSSSNIVATVAPPAQPVLSGRKIAVFASHRMFIDPVMEELKGKNDIRFFDGDSAPQIEDLMKWADIAWFEWCDQLLIEATRLKKSCPIVCRLHSYEAFTDMPSKVDWSKVDRLVFVNESVRQIFLQQVQPALPMTIIHNGVDTDRFVIPEQKKYGSKIASVGYINYKKNPTLLLYCFKKIHEFDPGATLHIAGTHQDIRIELYFQHFLNQYNLPVHFDGWVEDMPKWYRDKDFVISTSLFESFHYSIAEGMASGLMPMVHNWFGASNLYPQEVLFGDPDDCLRLYGQLKQTDCANVAEANRQLIVDRYCQTDRLADIRKLMSDVLQQNSEQPATGERRTA